MNQTTPKLDPKTNDRCTQARVVKVGDLFWHTGQALGEPLKLLVQFVWRSGVTQASLM